MYQNETAEWMVFGDSDWAGDREKRESTTAVLEKLGNHCIESVSCSQTVIALSSGEAECYALHQAPAGALQSQLISTGWRRIVRSDSAAANGISSRSGGSKLRHLGVKELWIQKLVQAQKLVIKQVGTDDNPASERRTARNSSTC